MKPAHWYRYPSKFKQTIIASNHGIEELFYQLAINIVNTPTSLNNNQFQQSKQYRICEIKPNIDSLTNVFFSASFPLVERKTQFILLIFTQPAWTINLTSTKRHMSIRTMCYLRMSPMSWMISNPNNCQRIFKQHLNEN